MYFYLAHHCSSSLFFGTLLSLSSPPTSVVLSGPLSQLYCIKSETVQSFDQIGSLPCSQQYLLFLASFGEAPPTIDSKISSKDRTATPTPSPVVVEDVSAYIVEPGVEILLAPAQVPMSPIILASDGSASPRGVSSGHSDRYLRRQKAQDDLTHLLPVASLTYSPMLVEAVVSCYTMIPILRASMHEEFEGIPI